MQIGGADGELGAVLRYLSQKLTMVTPEAKATLNDIATEEYVYHIYQWSTQNLSLFVANKKKTPSEVFFCCSAMPTERVCSLNGNRVTDSDCSSWT